MSHDSATVNTQVSSIRLFPGIMGIGEISIKLNAEGTQKLFHDMPPDEVERLRSEISTCIDEAFRRIC